MASVLSAVVTRTAADDSNFESQVTSSLRGSVAAAAAATCSDSWAYNCKDHTACCEAGFTCYQKTPNWAACLKTCTPGAAQPNDHGLWTCAVLGGQVPPTSEPSTSAPAAPPVATPSPAVPSTSAPTAPPTTSDPAPGEGCADEEASCGPWANAGDCTTNPQYMGEHCKLACGLCGSSGGPTQGQKCADAEPDCSSWAQSGQCDSNPQYMHFYCQASCNLCSP